MCEDIQSRGLDNFVAMDCLLLKLLQRESAVSPVQLIQRLLKESSVTLDDRIEALNSVCGVLEGDASGPQQHDQIVPVCEEIINTVCIPSLKAVNTSKVGKTKDSSQPQKLHAACELLIRCLGLSGSHAADLIDSVATLIDASLRLYCEEQRLGYDTDHKDVLDVKTAVEVMNYLLKHASNLSTHHEFETQLFPRVLDTLEHSRFYTEGTSSRVVGILLPKFLSNDDKYQERISALWELLLRLKTGGHDAVEKAFLLLCGLADHFFGRACSFDVTSQVEFWQLLQVGLLSGTNAMTRKRAMYLMKRAIDTISRHERTFSCADSDTGLLFWWSPAHAAQLMPVWQDYILIMETLDENQVHVVKPVLPRMKTLIAAMATVLPDPGCLLLHPSWLYTVYKKAFSHDNKHIHRWALLDILQLDLAASPHIITMGFTQFILGPVMTKLLQDTSLYNRLEGEKLGSCPVIGQAILPFLTKCLDMLGSAEKAQFMQDIITALSREPCGAIPLLYVTQALASVPPVPAWGDATLAQIRQVVMTHVMTNNITLRGAIQCYFAQAICNMADVEQVSLQQLASTLACLERDDGCMVRGTSLWGQVSRWLIEHGDHLLDLSSTQTGARTPDNGTHLCRFLQAGVQAAIQVSPEEAGSSDLPGRVEAHSIAMLLLLAVDGQHNVGQQQDTVEQNMTAIHRDSPEGLFSLESLLSPVVQVLNSARTHPYLPPAKADRCLHILACLMEEHGTSDMAQSCCPSTTQQLSQVLQSCLEETLAFLVQKLTAEITRITDISRVTMYTQLLKQFSTFYIGGNHGTNLVLGSLKTLVERSIQTLQAQDNQVSAVQSHLCRLAAMRSLACVCEIVQTGCAAYRGLGEALLGAATSLRLQDGFRKPADKDSELVSREDWGRAVCLYVESQWTVVDFLLWLPGNTACHALGSPADLMTCAMDSTEVATGMAAIQLMRTMERLIPLVQKAGESMCVAAMDCAWKLVQDFYRDTDHFWPVMYSFVGITFHPALMSAPPASTLFLRQQQYAGELFAMGERIRGVANVLLRHCCRYWAGDCSRDTQTDTAETALTSAVHISSATAHIGLILEAATFGPHFKRNLRTELDTIAYVKQLGNKCSVNEAYRGDERDDKQVRACIVNFLVSVSRHQEQWTPFIELLFTRLVEKDQEMTQKVQRYHLNAFPHRYKNRVWQMVLVILPHVSETLAAQYVDHLLNTLAAENQISVRYMVEWCLLLLMHKYPSLRPNLWDALRHDSDKRIGIMASLMEITAHLGLLLEDKQEQEAFFDQAFPAVMPWALVPHFAVRVFALSALQWMWRYCKDQGFTGLLQRHALLRPCLDAEENITAGKVWRKLTGNWYIYNFRPRQDYSIETIFRSLPYLSGVTDAEWISPNLFLQSPPSIWQDEESKHLPLWNPREDLRKCVYSLWKFKGPGAWTGQDENKQEESQAELPAEGNVQKKIITWRHTLEEPHLNMADMHIKVVRKGHLVVVASLIDKPTNLGGLCRTCEIFGVATLVLGNMKYVEDKTFQQLSVSSQGWVNIQEVRPGELPEYVEEMRRQGHYLIGVEQTADSRSLTEFTFPEKSLLLLGNEKEGIPVELIHQLDVCVEIPQQGIVRSLNVHVSGALLIWEYTRQQIIKD